MCLVHFFRGKAASETCEPLSLDLFLQLVQHEHYLLPTLPLLFRLPIPLHGFILVGHTPLRINLELRDPHFLRRLRCWWSSRKSGWSRSSSSRWLLRPCRWAELLRRLGRGHFWRWAWSQGWRVAHKKSYASGHFRSTSLFFCQGFTSLHANQGIAFTLLAPWNCGTSAPKCCDSSGIQVFHPRVLARYHDNSTVWKAIDVSS
mmetsp:Transcript_78437/g.159436  ORF Transcript_78437/g.159436 Transcript_78437/m.159436 type:complete len:203 (-) Transcript_78437:894-1502(-)